ncbi:MAG TPA: hypothetical protein VK174_16970, partial [Chitinophagales bacterium]|nr:hypothetical protein [Chitinophagales bacterium]
MKYIVRANNYNYNDENYYIECAGAIENIYDSREEAIEACNQLNIDEIDGYNRLNDFIYHSKNEDEIRLWLRKYYHQNFRISLDEADEYLEDDVSIPDTATDEQKLDIINNLDIRFFEVFEHDTSSNMVELKANPEFWGKMDYDPLAGEYGRSFYFSEAEALDYL